MKMTNNEIYSYAIKLAEVFADGDQKLPIKINFYLQKNKKTLMDLAQEIETNRLTIVQTYGKLNNESGQYIVPEENIAAATAELNDLFILEQDVPINMIKSDSLTDELMMTTSQMEAIMFMID